MSTFEEVVKKFEEFKKCLNGLKTKDTLIVLVNNHNGDDWLIHDSRVFNDPEHKPSITKEYHLHL